jgi:homoserine dehydrogenase
MTVKVALMGLGTVGKGVLEAVCDRSNLLEERFGEKVEIVAVLVKNGLKPRVLPESVKVTSDFNEVLSIPDLAVAIEAIVGCEPARNYNLELLKRGVHVISANKECIAYHGKELNNAARRNGVTFSFEASVAGGIPVIRTIREQLRVNRIEKIEGIFNGTCNYVLSMMRSEGVSFAAALASAQELGYAEADPSNDIEGWDAFYKLMILSETVYGEQPDWNVAERIGIEKLTDADAAAAVKSGRRIKQVAVIEQTRSGLRAFVRPISVGAGHPLYGVEGVDNAVHIRTDLLGSLILQGPGAGAKPTASAILEDLGQVLSTNSRFKDRLQAAR